MRNNYWIPRQLDAPPLFFLWEADTVVIVVILMMMGLMTSVILGMGLSYLCARGYVRLKEEGGAGLIVRLAYWFTPSDVFISKKLPSYIREYVGG